MCKGTEIAKFAQSNIIWPPVTELGLVLLRVVEGLHSVMALGAGISPRALTSLSILTHIGSVGAERPSSILVMVVVALFRIVAVFLPTWLCLERSKV